MATSSGRHADHALPSGFDALDAHLPGGGWPRRALTELLLPQPGVGEIRLLADSLGRIQQRGRLADAVRPAGAVVGLGPGFARG